ncbi:MAG: ABC transporter ATP-binding protein [Hyphomicrobiaceae bacterium]
MFGWFERQIDPFERGSETRPPERLLAFYWHYLQPIWPYLVLMLVVGFVGSIIEVSLFAYIGSLVDLMKNADSPASFFRDHGSLLLWMGAVALVFRPLVFALSDLIKNQLISPPFTNRVRWQTHRWVLRQSLGYFQNDFAGRIANKIMQTAPALRESVTQVIEAIWFVLVYTFSALWLFAEADTRLTAPLIAWLVLYIVALRYFVPRVKDRAVANADARSMLTGRIVDSYTNVMTVKLFAHADREDSYAAGAMREHLDTFRSQLKIITLMNVTVWALNGALMVATAGLALWLWSQGAVTIGAVALASGLSIRIVNMSGWIMWVVTGIFENIGAVQEGMETIARAHDVVDAPNAKPLEVERGEIRYEGIQFHYGKGNGVIDHLSLTIRPGEKVGLVGRSGAGKSTLVNLLLRFYDLEGGRILIDGQDIARVTQDSLRANIGMVTQDTSLLHRSVIDNILYGKPEASAAEAIAAARKAQADHFVPGLQDFKGRTGYQAHVGERGVKLSGGQRQRIAIARVLLKNAPILILDEATSALDSEVEAAIQEQLYNLMEGKTVIAIAHRLSTIATMDRLVIMDDGAIIEQGTHQALLQRGGVYADLWTRQSGGFLAEAAAE